MVMQTVRWRKTNKQTNKSTCLSYGTVTLEFPYGVQETSRCSQITEKYFTMFQSWLWDSWYFLSHCFDCSQGRRQLLVRILERLLFSKASTA